MKSLVIKDQLEEHYLSQCGGVLLLSGGLFAICHPQRTWSHELLDITKVPQTTSWVHGIHHVWESQRLNLGTSTNGVPNHWNFLQALLVCLLPTSPHVPIQTQEYAEMKSQFSIDITKEPKWGQTWIQCVTTNFRDCKACCATCNWKSFSAACCLACTTSAAAFTRINARSDFTSSSSRMTLRFSISLVCSEALMQSSSVDRSVLQST